MAALEKELLKIAAQLTEILQEESQALLANQRDHFNEIIERKIVICDRYEHCYRAWQQEAKPLSNTPENLAIAQGLSQAVEENATILRAAVGASERIFKTFVNAAEAVRRPIKTYNAKGRCANNPRQPSVNPAALTVDQKL